MYHTNCFSFIQGSRTFTTHQINFRILFVLEFSQYAFSIQPFALCSPEMLNQVDYKE